MGESSRPKPRRERILIIMDARHAQRVAEAAAEFRATSYKRLSEPKESRYATALVVALRLIVNRPKGWYDTAFREALKREVRVELEPRVLTHEELQVVMDRLYAIIPPREDTDELQALRDSRPNESKGKK